MCCETIGCCKPAMERKLTARCCPADWGVLCEEVILVVCTIYMWGGVSNGSNRKCRSKYVAASLFRSSGHSVLFHNGVPLQPIKHIALIKRAVGIASESGHRGGQDQQPYQYQCAVVRSQLTAAVGCGHCSIAALQAGQLLLALHGRCAVRPRGRGRRGVCELHCHRSCLGKPPAGLL